MLMIRGANYNGIHPFDGEQILVVNALLRLLSGSFLYHRNCLLALLAPGVTHCCDFYVCVLTELQDLLQQVPGSTTDHSNGNTIVGPKNPSRADGCGRSD
jgi:hypothetical protein